MPLPVILGGIGAAVAIKEGVKLVKDVAVAGAEAARANIPILSDIVTVEVQGQPGAKKQELYFLALSAASGVIRKSQSLFGVKLNPPTAASLSIEYDAAENWVRCIFSYVQGTMNAVVIPPSSGNVLPTNNFFDNMAIYRGPSCDVVGGAFPLSQPVVIPGFPTDAKSPSLPWSNQTILTTCPKVQSPTPPAITNKPVPSFTPVASQIIDSPNPKPPGDNRSRGVLVRGEPGTGGQVNGTAQGTPECCDKSFELAQLVFAALTDPGSAGLISWIPPTGTPLGS